jgi:hypothetical protein
MFKVSFILYFGTNANMALNLQYPNLAGVVCACVQLGLHIMYWHKTGALADFEAEDDDDPLGEGLMDEGTGEGTLIDNIRLFFSEDPFFV